MSRCDSPVRIRGWVLEINLGRPFQREGSELETPKEGIDQSRILSDAVHFTEKHQAAPRQRCGERGFGPRFDVDGDLLEHGGYTLT